MLTVFATALAIRILNILFLPLDPPTVLHGDAMMYWNGARYMIEFGGFVDAAGEPETERVPFYFLFLALHKILFGAEFLPPLLSQAVIDSVTCLLVARLAGRIAPALMVPAGLLAAAWPSLWIHSAQLLTDTLFLFFFTGALLALLHFLQAGGGLAILLAGLAIGSATMTRPVTQLMLLGLIVFIPAWTWLREKSLRRACIYGLVFLAAAVLPLLPHMVRNVTHFGTWALTSQNGNHLLNWVLPEIYVLTRGKSRAQAVKEMAERARIEAESLGVSDLARAPPFEKSHVYMQTALSVLREMPAVAIVKAWLQGAVINMAAPALLVDNRVQQLPHGSFMEATKGGLPDRLIAFVRLSSPAYLAALTLGVGAAILVGLLQVMGLAIHLRRQTWVAALGIATVLYFLLINGPIASPKYRLPMEPILVAWTALALGELKERWRARRVYGRSSAVL